MCHHAANPKASCIWHGEGLPEVATSLGILISGSACQNQQAIPLRAAANKAPSTAAWPAGFLGWPSRSPTVLLSRCMYCSTSTTSPTPCACCLHRKHHGPRKLGCAWLGSEWTRSHRQRQVGLLALHDLVCSRCLDTQGQCSSLQALGPVVLSSSQDRRCYLAHSRADGESKWAWLTCCRRCGCTPPGR